MPAIGARIKLARKMARRSQRDLADEVGVSAMSISKYENHRAIPSSDILMRLAEALDVRFEFFLRSTPEMEIEPAYRRHTKLSVKAEQAVIAEIQEWLERYNAAESFFPPAEIPRFWYPAGQPYRVASPEDAERAAEELRAAWNLGEDAIENLTELLEAQGIKVGVIDGDEHFDACTFWINDETPVIAVKRDMPGDRERFSLAHELGHIFLSVAEGFDVETAANRFAGAFLVPESAVRRELGSSRTSIAPEELYLLKHKYGLSMGAWLHRAEELGILSESRARQMWDLFNQSGWKLREPGEQLDFEEPGRLRRLVHRLIAEDIISRSKGAELLGVPVSLSSEPEVEAVGVYS